MDGMMWAVMCLQYTWRKFIFYKGLVYSGWVWGTFAIYTFRFTTLVLDERGDIGELRLVSAVGGDFARAALVLLRLWVQLFWLWDKV